MSAFESLLRWLCRPFTKRPKSWGPSIYLDAETDRARAGYVKRRL